MITTLLFAALLSQTPSASALSPQSPAAPPVDALAITDFVVVSAALVDLPLSRVTASVTVIPQAELDARQIENVAEALRSVSGLSIATSGGRGATTSIFTRGGESDFTTVLVDGVALNEFGGSVGLAHLSPANIDRIEIVRGPQGATFGGGAIAGVVNVISAVGGPASARLTFEGGSEVLRRGALDARGSIGAWHLGGGADFVAADGFTGTSAAGTPVSNDDYRRTEISLVAAREINANARARVSARWNDNDRGFPGPYGSDPAGTFSGIDTISRGANTQTAISAVVDASTGRLSHRITGTWMRLDSDFASPFGDSTSGTDRASARYVADWAAMWGGVSAGVDITRESGRSTFIVDRDFNELPVERTLAGYFAETRAALGTRVLVTAGARLDQIRRAALAGDASPFGARPDIAASTVWSFNPRASAMVLLTPADARHTARLRAEVSTGIRPPSAFELSSTDNPELEPERNRSAEVAFEQTIANGRLTLSASAFWNRYDDLIITVGQSIAGASQYRSDNLSNSTARGLELAAEARGTGALGGLTARVGYTWLRTEILAADGSDVTGLAPFEVGDSLLRRPAHHAFADATFTRGPVTAFASFETRGRTLDIDPSFGLFGGLYDNDGFATSSAGLTWRLFDHISLFGRATNLFDRRYEEILGFPAQGRQLIGGVRIAAGR